MVTATAHLIKSATATSGVLAPIVSAALIAAMWGTFVGAKIKAGQVTSETYGEGGDFEVGGGTHASGNDTSLGVHGGKERRVERGERVFIVNRRNSKKYSGILPTVIDSLNSGNFENMIGGSFVAVNTSKMEGHLENIEKQGKRRTYMNSKGQLVEHYRNIKRTYV